jgi:hypothetical protein
LEGKQSFKEKCISWLLTVLYFIATIKGFVAILSDNIFISVNSYISLYMIDFRLFYPRDNVFLFYITVKKILLLTNDRNIIENYSLIKETMIDIRNLNSGFVLNYKYRKRFQFWIKLIAITFPINNAFAMLYTIIASIMFALYFYLNFYFYGYVDIVF